MQLVAYGAQDIYLTGNPQITFFKVVYRRHTNFSMEAIQQTFNGAVGFGNRVSATISRNGDLVGRMYLEYNPSELVSKVVTTQTSIAANIGNLLVKEAELEIGGQKIDKHYGHWMTCWSGLTDLNPTGAQAAPVDTAGATGGTEPATGSTLLQKLSYNHAGRDQNANSADLTGAPTKAFVPLQFWFCRNPGLALPLIALQYHEVKTYITFPAKADLYEASQGTVTSALTDAILYADYIYLDTDERRRFAQVSHEYLIEQVQFESFASTDTTLALNFNHPVKELVFTGAPVAVKAAGASSGMSTPEALGDGTIQLKLNGHDRFSARDRTYFTRTQVWQHHTGYGSVGNKDSVGVYSFALKPEEHQPSGTCNFSRIDNAQLVLGAVASANGTNVYAVNYNVLRIMSGMGGLAYSN